MFMWKLKLLVSVILISLCVVSWKYERIYTNKINFVDVCGNVYKKYDSPSKYGPKFIMVVRMDNGKVFDLNVSASTYATKDIGDRVCFTKIWREKIDNNYPKYAYTISTIWFIFNFIISLGTFVTLIIFICNGNEL